MTDLTSASIHLGGDVQGSVLITGSHNVVILGAQQARQRGQDAAACRRPSRG